MEPWLLSRSNGYLSITSSTIQSIRAFSLHVDRSAVLLSAVNGIGAKLFLNSEDLVHLGHSLTASRGSGLDLSSAKANTDIADGNVLTGKRSA
jgi:hypothetical protein